MQASEHSEEPQIQTKVCCDCLQHQPVDLFNINSAKADGLQRYCIHCGDVRKRLYAEITASNAEVILE